MCICVCVCVYTCDLTILLILFLWKIWTHQAEVKCPQLYQEVSGYHNIRDHSEDSKRPPEWSHPILFLDIEKPRPREGNYLAQGHTVGWRGSQEQGTSKTLHVPPTWQHEALGVTFNLIMWTNAKKNKTSRGFYWALLCQALRCRILYAYFI